LNLIVLIVFHQWLLPLPKNRSHAYDKLCRSIQYKKQDKKAVLSWGEPRNVAVNFDTYRILQQHCAFSMPYSTAFLLGCVCSIVR